VLLAPVLSMARGTVFLVDYFVDVRDAQKAREARRI
jgi:hypothetical protein